MNLITTSLPSLEASISPAGYTKEIDLSVPFVADSRRCLLIYDPHIPYHVPLATNIAFTEAKKQSVDTIIFGGDVWDCYPISEYGPDPRRAPMREEFKQVKLILADVRKMFPRQQIIYMEGNHEERLKRYFNTKAKEFAGMPGTELDGILGLTGMDIQLVDGKRRVALGKLNVYHGHEFRGVENGVNPARSLFMKTKAHGVMGHCHRKSEHSENVVGGGSIACFSVGCLCELTPYYMPYNNWVHGFAIVDVDSDGHYTMHNYYISKDGRVY